MTLTEKKIERMVHQYQYIRTIFQREDLDPQEQMTRLYHFLRDQMQDVEMLDRQEAIEKRNRLNCGYTKAGH